MLHVFRDPPLDGPTNMARDEHLLYADDLKPAVLRLYAWSPPTISLGYFQRFERLAELPENLRRLAIVRRSTGGGAILHDQEVTYCLIVHDSLSVARQSPATLYSIAHGCWQAALSETGLAVEIAGEDQPLPTPRNGPFFCFEKPGRTDLVLGGHKLLGSAQRRIAGRVLQHGSLLLAQRHSGHPGANLDESNQETVRRWCDRFVERIASVLGLAAEPGTWSDGRLADVGARRTKYAGREWTQRY